MAKTITSVYLDEDVFTAFKMRAKNADKSVSALMRYLIDIYMAMPDGR